jgi:hypothetical protein
MPYPNEHAARIRDPGAFEPESFRSKDLPNGIRIIVAKLKGGTAMIVQAYRFAVDKFTVEEAKKWLEDHKIHFIKFEPASETGGSMDNQIKHAGVPGMKWGVRNKRDMPGETGGKKPKAMSTEPVRKKRDMPGETGGKKPRKISSDAKEVTSLRKKHVTELSNEELQKVSRRLDLEKRYKDLNPSKVTKGKKTVEGVFSAAGRTAGVIGTVAALAATGKKIYDFAKAHKVAIPPDFSI